MYADVYYTDGTDEYKFTFKIDYKGQERVKADKEYLFLNCLITRVKYYQVSR